MSGLVENKNNEKPAHTKRWESGSSWHKLSNYHLTEVLTEQGPHNPLPQKYMTGVRNSRTMAQSLLLTLLQCLKEKNDKPKSQILV